MRIERGWLSGGELDRLRAVDVVRDVRATDGGLVVVLDDASHTDQLARRLEELGIPGASVAPHAADLDEVFVAIVQAHRARARDGEA